MATSSAKNSAHVLLRRWNLYYILPRVTGLPLGCRGAHSKATAHRTKRSWSQEEISRLFQAKKHKKSWSEIAEMFPTRTIHALCKRFSDGALTPALKLKQWTDAEDAQLLKIKKASPNSSNISWADVSTRFPGRSVDAVKVRYYRKVTREERGDVEGLRHFTAAESDKIFELRDSAMSRRQIHADYFPERSVNSITNLITARRRDCHNGKERTMQRWLRSEEKQLLHLRNTERKPFAEVAAILGRSYGSTTSRHRLLTEGTIRVKVPTADAYSPTESAKIAQMMKTKASVTDMAAAIGRTKASVNSYITQRRTELGYLRKRSTWDERRGVVVQAKQYRQEGLTWGEIVDLIPGYSSGSIRNWVEKMSTKKEQQKALSESEMHRIGAKIRRCKEKNYDWPMISTKVTQYSQNLLKDIHVQTLKALKEAPNGEFVDPETNKVYSLKKTKRPKAEKKDGEIVELGDKVDLAKLAELKKKKATWEEIRAHMPQWSANSLQNAWYKAKKAGWL